MRAVVEPGRLAGSLAAVPSKSQSHRFLIAAGLSENPVQIHNLILSKDVQATQRCMAALRREEESLPLLDCGESGSTLRFLMPLALVLRGGAEFTGQGRLMQRPQGQFLEMLAEKGVHWEQKGQSLTLRGKLEAGEYALPGNVSSQFITGLLFALPLLKGDSRIRLTSNLESEDYVNMTLGVLQQFGIQIRAEKDGWFVPGGQCYAGTEKVVEGDWSAAAFWLAANVLGSKVELGGLDFNSLQGDRAAWEICRRLAEPGDVTVDASGIPDLVPPLAAAAAVRSGTTRFVNAARLRIKESDRLSAVTQVLGAMGAQVQEGEDSLTLTGVKSLKGGVQVSAHNDHRIAMMAAVAATVCEAPVAITGAESVEKSYPDFWRDFAAVGGKVQLEEA